MDEVTNPAEPEVTDAPELDTPETDTTEQEIEFDDQGNPIEPDPELEEDDQADIEYEGKQFKVPKELKDAFLRQSDYTRKTQEVAEIRRTLEGTLQQATQLSQAEKAIEAQFIGVQQALATYEEIDWRAWMEQDPVAANTARMEYEDLHRQRGALANQHQQAANQRLAMAQQEKAKRIAEGQKFIAERIPNWGTEAQQKLVTHAVNNLGFTATELNAIDDPRIIIALHEASQFRQLNQRQKTAQKVQKQEAVKPAAKVQGKTPAYRGLDDRMSADAWVKARNAQLAKR